LYTTKSPETVSDLLQILNIAYLRRNQKVSIAEVTER